MSTAEITLGKTADSKDSAENGEVNGIASSRENSAEKEKEAVEEDSKTEEEEATGEE